MTSNKYIILSVALLIVILANVVIFASERNLIIVKDVNVYGTIKYPTPTPSPTASPSPVPTASPTPIPTILPASLHTVNITYVKTVVTEPTQQMGSMMFVTIKYVLYVDSNFNFTLNNNLFSLQLSNSYGANPYGTNFGIYPNYVQEATTNVTLGVQAITNIAFTYSLSYRSTSFTVGSLNYNNVGLQSAYSDLVINITNN